MGRVAPRVDRLTRAALLGVAAGAALAACGADGDSAGSTGQGLYASNCASCHGGELEGNDSGPPLRSVIYGPDVYGDDELRTAIDEGVSGTRWGIGPMPAFGRLSDEHVDLIIEHIRAEQQRLGLLDVTP